MTADPTAFAERVLRQAEERGCKLANAESCIAGCLATLLADAPGASEQFHAGFVVYSKQQKHVVLGVPIELIAAQGHGAAPLKPAPRISRLLSPA